MMKRMIVIAMSCGLLLAGCNATVNAASSDTEVFNTTKKAAIATEAALNAQKEPTINDETITYNGIPFAKNTISDKTLEWLACIMV